jgi:hypothetical protein
LHVLSPPTTHEEKAQKDWEREALSKKRKAIIDGLPAPGRKL